MSRTLTTEAEHRLSWPRIVVVLTALFLVMATAGNVWVYFKSAHQPIDFSPLRQGGDPRQANTISSSSQAINESQQRSKISRILGGVGGVLLFVLTIAVWRQSFTRRTDQAHRQNRELREQLDGAKFKAQKYHSERSLLEAELEQLKEQFEQRIATTTEALHRKCLNLENELNSRRQAEQALTFQAKELERSKDVLELHVQARTKELQELKSRYELILNSAGDGIYGMDLNGRTTFVNPAAAEMTGWEVKNILGKREREIFYGLDEESSKEDFIAQQDGQGRYLDEQVFRRSDGGKFHVEYVRTTITENEKVVGSVVIFKDITERKRNEDALARKASELARSNAELEQFAYVASHDLQEPLRKIQAFGDRLRSKCQGVLEDDSADYLCRMLNAAARMQTLINDLLTFSRVISTTQPFRPVDLTKVTREVLSDLEVRIEQSKATVEVGELPTVDGDHTQMRQLLQNLVSNALKFHAPERSPHVKIYCKMGEAPYSGGDGRPAQQLCNLYVEDNGIGFEDCYLDKIFAVFQRLHGRSEFEGTGVGLAVCRRIVDRHGGIITAQGNPGEGSVFIVTLPVQQPQTNDAT